MGWCRRPIKEKMEMAESFIQSGDEFRSHKNWELAIAEYQCTLRLFEHELATRESTSKGCWDEVSRIAITCQTNTAGCLLEAAKNATKISQRREQICAKQ